MQDIVHAEAYRYPYSLVALLRDREGQTRKQAMVYQRKTKERWLSWPLGAIVEGVRKFSRGALV